MSAPPELDGDRDFAVPTSSHLPELAQVTPDPPRPSSAPPEWRDELLTIACSVPIHDGVKAATRACVDALTRLFPGHAVGACVVDLDGGDRITHRRLPDGVLASGALDPARLFPNLRYEWACELDADLGGSTLHVAGASEDLSRKDSWQRRVGQQAATVLSATLRRARVVQQTREAQRDFAKVHGKIVQAEKLASLGQLVAGIIHELNNPLTSIVAYSDYLKRKGQKQKADADDLERLARINEAAERILKFSRDLVAYARPANDAPGPVPLVNIIEKALVFCEHEFAENGVDVVREWGPDIPSVHGIAGQLTQVFVNLFTNAAHAMSSRGGVLRVSLRSDPKSGVVIAEVSDQGTGIAAPDLVRIFEPFFTTKTDGRGTGLGLSIVREIVSTHGGSVSARSSESGTTFTLVVPISR